MYLKTLGVTKQYWNALRELPEHEKIIWPMGGGGRAETPYRHYFELRHFKQKVPLNKSLNIVEFGCGNGRWIFSLAPLVRSYTGVDLNRDAIRFAQRFTTTRNLRNVTYSECSLTDFQGERQYDVVYFSGVTQYLQDEEIIKILHRLKPYLTPQTLIIDRSTVNYRKREISRLQNYFSIYRTPYELEQLFLSMNYSLSYQKRSYRFLRLTKFIHHPFLNRIVYEFIILTQPVSYYIMWGISYLADIIHPIPFEGGDRSHDFFIFTLNNYDKKI